MVPQVSPIELSPNREALEPHDPSREHPDVERIPEVTPHRVQPHGERVGSSYPIGPIMKVKYFRLNVVFESSVTVLWALVYVLDGLPIGKINVAGTLGDSVPGALYEPQQFIITSGVYTSQGSSGASAPLRVWTPLARNLNPGDGVFLVWQALTSASSIPTVITLNYSSCVN